MNKIKHAESQQRLREKKKKKGLVRIELWIKPEWKQAIIDKLNELKGK